ncbi:MAG: 4Fe-4S dicluster domain-containing protein [Actinobacteria bacterium]|nr:4Fe-4S dicluster domain-containing protein [Actinomycetota bacterium]
MALQYGIVVDTKRCIGCWTCSVTCKLENNIPEDVWWNRVLTIGGKGTDTPAGEWPNLKMSYVVMQCQHCSEPECVKVCPVGAPHKDPETGIVMQDPDKCIGCRYCIAACPYTGVRSFNWDEPKPAMEFPGGNSKAPDHQKHTVEKCTMCAHRVLDGELPACVEGCPARARFFGDLNDSESDVSKLIATREHMQLLPEKETGPNIYYLV